MKKRLEALKRIGRLQDRLRELAHWRATALARERAGAADDLREVFAAMQESDFAYGATAALGQRRARAIERKIAALAADHEAQALKAKAEAVRAKLAEGALETAAARHRALVERRELAELIERTLHNLNASLT